MAGVTLKVSCLTLGCRVNQSETSVIEGTLKQNGIAIVPLHEHPDFCIINTCTVTGKSDATSRQLIRKAAKTGAKVIVTGCYSELRPDEVLGMDGVFSVVPAQDKEKIAGAILGSEAKLLYHHHDRARPYLKVQDGCNFSCSYCAVPLARGRSRSLLLEAAVQRARDIDAQGYHEIVLTGIHLGSYGQDLAEKTSLAELIKNILAHTGIHRIRLSSLEINEVGDELMEVLADSRICRHLHLPLQSGSDKILRLMSRNYSAINYKKTVIRIAEKYSDLSIGTDVIAGFPGEGQKEFQETYQMIQELPFSYLHIFPYSVRAGTAASHMKPSIPATVITERTELLRRLSRAKKERHVRGHLQKILDVIIEEKEDNGYMSGTASNYLKVRMRSDNIKPGSMVFVRSTAVEGTSLKGFVVT
jgi:threonylcarbamoyladenosine tRNA methylthiotransferase MtaB